MFNYTTFDESKVEFLDIAPVSELPNGERLFIEVEGKSLVIFNIAGQYFSIGISSTIKIFVMRFLAGQL